VVSPVCSEVLGHGLVAFRDCEGDSGCGAAAVPRWALMATLKKFYLANYIEAAAVAVAGVRR